MAVQITAATEAYRQDWDNYVSQHSDVTPYHRYAWLAAVTSAYGHKNASLIALEGDTVVGVLPLVNMPVPMGKARLVSLPFCDLGYPLADTAEIRAHLLQKAEEKAQQLNAAVLDIRDYQRQSLDQDDTDGKKVSMLLPLPEDKDALWAGFKSKLRSQVRKAEKNGLDSEVGNSPALIDEFYDVFAENMRKLGSPVHAKQWFKSLAAEYGDALYVGVVRNEGRCIGAGIVITAGDKMAIPWASTLAEFNRLSPNMLLYWNFLALACDLGKSEFDFGRSTAGEGTFKFKQQWGAAPRPLDWHDLLATEVATESAGGTSRLRPYIEKTWSSLPLGITKCVGPLLRKHISL